MNEDVFSTTDLNLSILDYLNIEESRPTLTGRSFFRDYDSPRPMLMAQEQSIALSKKKGEITRCPKQAQSFAGQVLGEQSCVNLLSENGQVFSGSYRAAASPTDAEHDTVFSLQALADTRLQTQRGSRKDIVISQDALIPLVLNRGVELLAGQYLTFPHGARITLSLDLSYKGEKGAYTELRLSANDRNSGRVGSSFLAPLTLPNLLDGEQLNAVLEFSTLNTFEKGQTLLRGIARRGHGEIFIHNYTISIDTDARAQSPSLRLVSASISKGKVTAPAPSLDQTTLGGALALSRTQSLDTGETLLFGDASALVAHGARGFWPTEKWGSWTKETASINLALDGAARGRTLKVLGSAMLAKGTPSMPTKVFVNNIEVAEWAIKGPPKVYSVDIPETLTLGSNTNVRFELQGQLSSPHDINPDVGDQRPLGLALRSLTLNPAK
jgi:hypothetical protein